MPLRYLWLFLLLTYANVGQSQSFSTDHPDFNYKNFQIAEGEFFSNFIYDLHQDRDGFIWICTLNGLFRFDGYRYKHYRANPNEINSISGDNPIKIMADKAHGFWVAVRPNGIVLSGGGIDYFDPLEETFTNYLLDSIQNNAGVNIVNELLWPIDEDYFWVGTEDGLVQYFPATHQQKRYRISIKSAEENKIYSLLEGEDDQLWVGTAKGLYIFKNGQFSKKSNGEKVDCKINSLLFKNKEELLIGSFCGLYNYQLKNGLFSSVSISHTGNQTAPKLRVRPEYVSNVKTLKKDKTGAIWIGNETGLFLMDTTGAIVTDKSPKIRLNETFQVNRVNSILQDQSGTFWIGKSNGISKIYPLKDKIQKYELVNPDYITLNKQANTRYFNLDGTERSDNCSIKAIFSNNDTCTWVGTSCGLYQFDKKSAIFYQNHWIYERIKSLKLKNITAILVDSKNNFWIGTNNFSTHPKDQVDHRLYRLNQQEKTVFFLSNKSSEKKIPWGAIKSLVEDEQGHIWIACSAGLAKYLPESDALITFVSNEKDTTSLSSNRVRLVFADREDRIWIGTADAGLNLYQPETKDFRQFRSNTLTINSLSNARINAMCQTQDGTIWIGTELGINSIHPINFSIKRYFFKNRDNKIRGLLEKEAGVLWVSTNAQLFSYEIKRTLVTNYSIEDGFGDDRFISPAYFKDKASSLYFGGIKGFYRIEKDALQKDQFAPPLVYTALSIRNERLSNKIIQQSFSPKTPLTLTAKQNFLTVQFATLDYVGQELKKYRYKLTGIQEEWQLIGAKNELSFSNLKAGNYTLNIEGSNADGLFNTKAKPIYIRLLPPWYWTWWSKLLYFIIGLGTLYAFYRFQLNRRLMAMETLRLQELGELKTKLYTNITHEFRTPLTVIQGMANQINTTTYAVEKELISRNSQNLLSLINQLLDLSKLEAGEISVDLTKGDIVQYLRYILESFHSLATDKGLILSMETDIQNWIMCFDKEKIRIILSNLISNALKYTQEGGAIKLKLTKKQLAEKTFLQLQIADTGIGIAKDKTPFVFDRFYQAAEAPNYNGESTGVGLAITKELMQLLGGQISLESDLGKGTVFTILLPDNQEANKVELMETATISKEEIPSKINLAAALATANLLAAKDAAQLLLVEDNTDVLYYLISYLQGNYQLLVAKDGEEGFEMAKLHVPDLIISDVMMPKMNGYVLCELVKKTNLTSHIPFILLTAKVSQNDRIAGLEKGADAYLTKPFNQKELSVRIQQLLTQREQLQLYYTQHLLEDSKNKPFVPLSAAEEFLQKVIEFIETNIDQDIDLDDFSQSLFMSRSQLYRKIKALTGYSTTIFIRRIRLKKAWHLLKTTNKSISEISYHVGFKDPAFFSRSFSEVFAQTPRDFRKKWT